jgi:hypothetical protein
MDNNEEYWNEVASKMLVGRRVASVKYMSEKEAKKLGWFCRPLMIQLNPMDEPDPKADEEAVVLIPMRDDEGNDGGALATSDKENGTLPVLWIR